MVDKCIVEDDDEVETRRTSYYHREYVFLEHPASRKDFGSLKPVFKKKEP